MQFWGYLLMSKRDQKNLLISYSAILPYLKEAVRISRMHHKKVILKYFPECLLAYYRRYLNNSQPELVIGAGYSFWNKFRIYNFSKCISCDYQKCVGLPLAYKMKYNDIWNPKN